MAWTTPDPTTVGWLRRGIERAPHAVAVCSGETSLTYAELGERCARLSAALRGRLNPGDRVAVLAANSPEYLELYLGVTGAGLVVVPLDPARSAAELRVVLRDAGVAAVFADRDVSALGAVRAFALGPDYEKLLADGAAVTPGSAAITPDMVAALFYTGGTTGMPKGVMLTHGNLAANARNLSAALDVGPGTRWLVAAPMFHISGTIGSLATIGSGGRHVLAGASSPEEMLDVVQRHAVTTTLVLPPMLAALAAAQLRRPRQLASLRMITHGGGPITEAEVIRAHAAFPQTELVHLYGATELSPIAAVLRGEQQLIGAERGRSCGRPVGGVAVEIRAPSGSRLPAGEYGEVVVRGDTVMAGYWRRPEASAAVLEDGWYRTGDLGCLDEDGYLYVVDRASDAIRDGDRMIFSTTVERALRAIDGVAEAAALPAVGGGIHAVVVSHDAGAVADACRAVLEGFGTRVVLTMRSEELPRSGAGKIFKRRLREPAARHPP